MTAPLSRRAALAGLAASAGLAGAGGATACAHHTITITGMAFVPPDVPLAVGEVVIWRNDDIFRHTATARDGSFDLDLPASAEARLTLKSAGEIEVYCRFHPGMELTLSVAAA